MYLLTFRNTVDSSSVLNQDVPFPCSATRDTHPSPRSLALKVLPKIDVEFEGSESRLEKESEPTATTKKATKTVIRGSIVGESSTSNSLIADSDTRLQAREKGDPKEYKIHGSHFAFVH